MLESLYGSRILTEAIGHVCFKSFGTKSVYFVLSNTLPLYCTGVDSGIVVDCGFQQTEILPICRSRVCPEALESSQTGGCVVEKELNRLLIQDNKTNNQMLQATTRLPLQFPPYVLEHIKTRCCSVLARKQKLEYFKTPEVLESNK